MYARTFEPMLDSSVMHKLTHFYAKIRKVSDNFGGIKLTPRHLESIIRISEGRFSSFLSKGKVITEKTCIAG